MQIVCQCQFPSFPKVHLSYPSYLQVRTSYYALLVHSKLFVDESSLHERHYYEVQYTVGSPAQIYLHWKILVLKKMLYALSEIANVNDIPES